MAFLSIDDNRAFIELFERLFIFLQILIKPKFQKILEEIIKHLDSCDQESLSGLDLTKPESSFTPFLVSSSSSFP